MKKYIEELSLALDNFVKLIEDKNVNSAFTNKFATIKYQDVNPENGQNDF